MQVHIATSTVPRTFKSRISYPFSDTVEAHIPVTARPMPNSSKLTVAKTLAEALRHKTQSLVSHFLMASNNFIQRHQNGIAVAVEKGCEGIFFV